MTRLGLSFVFVAVLIAGACGGSDNTAQAPTGPTTTPPSTTPPPTSSCAPPAPTNLTVTQTASSTRVFTWNASANAVDYIIGIGSSSGNSDLIYTNTTQTTYTWTGQSVTEYFYYARVYARNSCGSSAWSNQIVFH